jgi:hypothetical protein
MSKCFNHTDTQAIAECRICGKNVCDECGIALGGGEGFACCSQCEQEALVLIHRKKFRRRICVFSFFGSSVALTLVFVFPMLGHGNLLQVFFSLFGVAAGIVLLIWFIVYFSYHIYMRITRGAPFRVGDCVVVTDGPHKGAKGEVLRLGDRLGVVVALKLDGVSSNYGFDWSQIRKVKKKQN